MYKTVKAYTDNLIAWGNSLFRQDTEEAIDEALMLYVLATKIQGPNSVHVPKKGTVRWQTYDNLCNDMWQFGIVMRDMEPEMPFNLMPFPSANLGNNARMATLRRLGKTLYCCVPRNISCSATGTRWPTVSSRSKQPEHSGRVPAVGIVRADHRSGVACMRGRGGT